MCSQSSQFLEEGASKDLEFDSGLDSGFDLQAGASGSEPSSEKASEKPNEKTVQSQEEKAEESRRIRRLQWMMSMVTLVIQRDRSLQVEQASEMVASARRAALAMFPDKAQAFDLIFWPRLQRLMRERYRMQ